MTIDARVRYFADALQQRMSTALVWLGDAIAFLRPEHDKGHDPAAQRWRLSINRKADAVCSSLGLKWGGLTPLASACPPAVRPSRNNHRI
jgi:hypothetical protein